MGNLFTKYIKDKKLFIFIFIVFLFAKSNAQNLCDPAEYIMGNWKCVKVMTGKADFFNPNDIKSSVLTIEQHRLYYTGPFKASCNVISKWVIDTDIQTKRDLLGMYYSLDYPEFYAFKVINTIGTDSGCGFIANIFLKQDTILNNSGGDTFWLLKIPTEKRSFQGGGDTTMVFELTKSATALKIRYHFFDPDASQLQIEDQNGKQVLLTKMTVTRGGQTIVVPLNDVTKLIFKVKGAAKYNIWDIDVETE